MNHGGKTMSQTIYDLWNGNIAPAEHCGSHDSDANHLFSLMARNRETLYGELSDTQKEILQKYADCSEEYLLRMLELAFRDGFSLGCKLVMESLL